MKTHKDLDVWKNGISLVTNIYEVTKLFPKEEIYGIISQIRRSAVSIPSNIAEGAARNHNKEFIQFLYMALASLAELETQLIISDNLNYLPNDKFNLLNDRMNEIRSQLCGLIKYLKKKSFLQKSIKVIE